MKYSSKLWKFKTASCMSTTSENLARIFYEGKTVRILQLRAVITKKQVLFDVVQS